MQTMWRQSHRRNSKGEIVNKTDPDSFEKAYVIRQKDGRPVRILEPEWKTDKGELIRINAASMNRFFTDEQQLVERYENLDDGRNWQTAGKIKGKIYKIGDEIKKKQGRADEVMSYFAKQNNGTYS